MKLVANVDATSKSALVSVDNEPEIRCPLVKQSNGGYCVNVSKTTWPRQWVSVPGANKGLTDCVIERDSEALRPKNGPCTGGTANSGKIWTASIEMRLRWFLEYSSTNLSEAEAKKAEAIVTKLVDKALAQDAQAKKLAQLEKLEAEAKKIQEQIKALSK